MLESFKNCAPGFSVTICTLPTQYFSLPADSSSTVTLYCIVKHYFTPIKHITVLETETKSHETTILIVKLEKIIYILDIFLSVTSQRLQKVPYIWRNNNARSFLFLECIQLAQFAALMTLYELTHFTSFVQYLAILFII